MAIYRGKEWYISLGGNNGCSSIDDTNKISTNVELDTMQENKASNLGVFVWPKFIICLSGKEKEEDFMAIKGSSQEVVKIYPKMLQCEYSPPFALFFSANLNLKIL